MRDYKEWIQQRAEDIAIEECGCEFYELSSETQQEIYHEAMVDYQGQIASEIGALTDDNESDTYGKGLYEKTTHVSRRLQNMARSLDIPIICLCQKQHSETNKYD